MGLVVNSPPGATIGIGGAEAVGGPHLPEVGGLVGQARPEWRSVAVPVLTQEPEQASSSEVSTQYSYEVAPDAASHDSDGPADWPMAPSAGASLPEGSPEARW